MKILVSIKQVPARDSQLKVAVGQRWIESGDLSYEINEPDAYALEAALQFREKHGGEVVVLCAGPESASSTIREALAKGADRALHVLLDDAGAWDVLSLARLLAAAARTESPDLVLTGLQSDDLGFGQTGVVMAELLGLPHATIVMQVDFDGAALRVKRELEDGWFQFVSMPLPALLTIQSGIGKLRYATLMGIKRARTKEVKQITPASLDVAPAPSAQLLRVYPPQRSKQTVMLEGSAREQAAQLVEKLKFEARVI
jgi:electron transfer flavoprotein beta subunit